MLSFEPPPRDYKNNDGCIFMPLFIVAALLVFFWALDWALTALDALTAMEAAK